MTEYKDAIPHTGGQLTIHRVGRGYQLTYVHHNLNRVALTELVAVAGEPVEWIDMVSEMRGAAPSPAVRIEFPSDAEGMWGRRCPSCKSYFRTRIPQTEFCPYCNAKADSLTFLTAHQRDFIKRQHDAIVDAMAGPEGDTVVNFEGDADDSWGYADERQQTNFKCANCGLKSDVLGEYVRCPSCGTRTARQVIERKLAEISADFESDAQNISTDKRDQRQRRWRHHVSACVAEFDALGHDISKALAALPCTAARRKAILELSLPSITVTADKMREWFAIDLLHGVDDNDHSFLNRMFNRRHLFAHNSGKVDQEYLDRTDDSTVRLNEVVKITSNETRRLIALVQRLAEHLLLGFESIS
jgi:Zn finger protein HypA/HybF involved in hydrogenase expression